MGDITSLNIDGLFSTVTPNKTTNTGKITANAKYEHSIEVIISVIIIILNIVEITLLLRMKRRKTNYETLLLSLSVADMLFGFSNTVVNLVFLIKAEYEVLEISFTLYLYFILTSIVHILLISYDRLWAVRKPIHHNVLVTRKKLIIVIMVTWLITTFVSFYVLAHDELVAELPNFNLTIRKTVAVFIFVAVVLYIACYAMIMQTIAQRKTFSEHGVNSDEENKMKAALIMCTLVACVFIFCNTPFAVTVFALSEPPWWASILLVVNSGANSVVFFIKGNYRDHSRSLKGSSEASKKMHALTQRTSISSSPAMTRKTEQMN